MMVWLSGLQSLVFWQSLQLLHSNVFLLCRIYYIPNGNLFSILSSMHILLPIGSILLNVIILVSPVFTSMENLAFILIKVYTLNCRPFSELFRRISSSTNSVVCVPISVVWDVSMSGQSPFLYYFVRIVTWWLTKSLLGNDLKHVSTATYTHNNRRDCWEWCFLRSPCWLVVSWELFAVMS